MGLLSEDMNGSLNFLIDTLDELVEDLNALGKDFMGLNEEFMGANNYTMCEIRSCTYYYRGRPLIKDKSHNLQVIYQSLMYIYVCVWVCVCHTFPIVTSVPSHLLKVQYHAVSSYDKGAPPFLLQGTVS